jgi:Protein of unknown function (DUF2971)
MMNRSDQTICEQETGQKVYRFQPYWHLFEDQARLHSPSGKSIEDKCLRAAHIEKDKLWFSTPQKLNDPTDLVPEINDDASTDDKNELLNEFVKRKYAQNSNGYSWLFDSELTADLGSGNAKFSDLHWSSSELCQLFQNRFHRLGLACFTPFWENLAMWAHYAQNHRGFVIEYRLHQFALLNRARDIWCLNVDYSSTRNIESLTEVLLTPDKAFKRAISKKSLDWSYEKELRLIHFDGGDKFVAIDPDAVRITGIIAGIESSEQQRKLLKAKCANWDVTYAEARLLPGGRDFLRKYPT